MKDLVNLLVSNIPGLLSAVITGVIILIIEYRTGWFADRSPIKVGNHKGFRQHSDPLDIFMSFFFAIILFLLIFFFVGFSFSLIVGQQTSTELDNPEDIRTSVKTIGEGDTKTFFGNELFVSVEKIFLDKISFSIGKPGYPNLTVQDVSNGYVTIYEADQRYDVRVTSINWASISKAKADFTVTRLQP